jgi:hypothetical protein
MEQPDNIGHVVCAAVFNGLPCTVVCHVERWYDSAIRSHVLLLTPLTVQEINGQIITVEALTSDDIKTILSQLKLTQIPSQEGLN